MLHECRRRAIHEGQFARVRHNNAPVARVSERNLCVVKRQRAGTGDIETAVIGTGLGLNLHGVFAVALDCHSLGNRVGRDNDAVLLQYNGVPGICNGKSLVEACVRSVADLCDRSTVPCARRSTCGNRSRGGSGRSRFGRRGGRRARFVRRRGIDLGLGNRAHRRRLNGRLGNRSKTAIRKSLRCKKAEGCHKPCCYRKNGMGAFFHGMPFLSYRARQNAGTAFLRHYAYGISEMFFMV